MPRESGEGLDVRALEPVVLPDAAGQLHRLGDYWAERRVVLVFARHFG